MSLIDALKSGNYQYTTTGSNNNIKINAGDGNNVINVKGQNADITTGNGNQTIFADINNNLNITTGSSGSDFIKASAYNANITTGDSDDTIKFEGTNFDISAMGGNNVILAKGDADVKSTHNTITTGNGNDQIVATSNGLTINDESGNLTSFVYGDGLTLDAGDGNHTVGFWGNDVNMDFGNGNNNIQTMDFTIANANDSTLSILKDFGIVDAMEKKVTASSEVIDKNVTKTEFDAKAEIAKRYHLSAQEQKILAGIDLDAKLASDGGPLYVIIKSPGKSTMAGKDVYVVAKRDGKNHAWSVSNGIDATSKGGRNYANRTECIATSAGWTSETYTGNDVTTTSTTTEYTYFLNGVKNVNINSGDGNNNVAITADSEAFDPISIDLGEGDNNIFIQNGFTVKDTDTKIETTTSSETARLYKSANSYNSPLIVDFNKDGKVSASAGKGVDVDDNGVADGAATGGDKMLAMSDMNGNNKIDGTEVFGNNTVSPFTGKKLDAANGFEALKLIAQEAEQYTGTKCIDAAGNVDLQALKGALATKGVQLGFISDNNTSNLEDLAHVASINVADYNEVDATGDVQNRQLGSYTDTDGNTQKVDDVWFTSKDLPKMDLAEFLKGLRAE
ncbi:MAG: hypothetical protein PHV37_07080 [Candidatus Gastranaerophilales bacterium]|nr:hypothetical protein [Candidatus Gastranaerophilales bacterium]